MCEVMTIGLAFEIIARESASGFSKSTLEAIEAAVDYLKKEMELTMMQSYVLSVIVENMGETISSQKLADYARISKIRILSAHEQIEALVDRGLIYKKKCKDIFDWNCQYSATPALINVVRYNHQLQSVDYQKMTREEVWTIIHKSLLSCDYHRISYQQMLREIHNILLECKHVDFCHKLSDQKLCDENLVLLLVICNCLANNEDYAALHDYDSIIPAQLCDDIVSQFKTNTNELISKELVEAIDSTCEDFRLTEYCRREIVGL